MDKQTAWIVGISALALAAFGPGLVHLAQLSWKQHVMDRRLDELEATHQQLLEEHRRLTTDPVYVEGLIRSTFKVAKSGEFVILPETLAAADRHHLDVPRREPIRPPRDRQSSDHVAAGTE